MVLKVAESRGAPLMNKYEGVAVGWSWGGRDEYSSEQACLEKISTIQHATGTGVWCKGALRPSVKRIQYEQILHPTNKE